MNPLIITILAAGEGKRMNSNIPKVLHLIKGKPMLIHIINTVRLLSPIKIIIVTGKYNDLIIETIKKYSYIYDLIFVLQKNPLGTGDAIKCCLTEYNNSENILILNGDMPLITVDILQQFINNSYINNTKINILTSKFKDPTSYGRIYIKDNIFIKIIEEKDCSEDERKIQIINSGLYFFQSEILLQFIPKIDNKNIQNEFYLTDIVKIIKDETKLIIHTFQINESNNKYISGVNTQDELVNLELL